MVVGIRSEGEDTIGSWKKERPLGHGGFGAIMLWRNMVTGELIAVKDCLKAASELSTKNYERWKQEVDILQKLEHPNVVKSFPIPKELLTRQSHLPSMAMEYCSGGDLRKVLLRPENCRGLTEKEVCHLLRDISSGLAYLHECRIIHRDLKPENVVLQDQTGEVTYKIIDLGYAKELDQSSLCSSFVGTLQYLAPELFEQHPYTKAVDYWSLGILAYEVATGRRPFFPNESPAVWLPLVNRKGSTHIAGDFNNDSIPVYCSKLPSSNHLTRVFREGLELWLQTLLERNPEKRGHRNGQSAHEMLEVLISQQVAHVFDVTDLTVASISHESAPSLSDLSLAICDVTGLAQESSLLLLHKGVELPEDIWEPCSRLLGAGAVAIYQFDLSMSEERCQGYRAEALLHVVNAASECECQPAAYRKLRELWAEGIFCIQQEIRKCHHMLCAYQAFLAHLRSQSSALHAEMVLLRSEMVALESKVKFAHECYTMDAESLRKLGERDIRLDSDKLYRSWACCDELLTPVDTESKATKELRCHANQLTGQIAEYEKTPFAKSKQPGVLEEKLKNILEDYVDARKNSKEAQHFVPICHKLQSELNEFVQEEARFIEECLTYIRHMCQLLSDIRSARARSRTAVGRVRTLSWEVSMQQRKRQEAIWSLWKAWGKPSRSSRASVPQQTITGSGTSSVSLGGTKKTVSEMVERSIRESSRVRQENAVLLREVASALDEMTRTCPSLASDMAAMEHGTKNASALP